MCTRSSFDNDAEAQRVIPRVSFVPPPGPCALHGVPCKYERIGYVFLVDETNHTIAFIYH